MANKFDRVVGASLAGGYGRGPAAGVDYFSDTGRQQGQADLNAGGQSNVNPGISTLKADAEAPDAGPRALLPETYGGGGGDGAPANSTVSDADLVADYMDGTRGNVLGLVGSQLGSTLAAPVASVAARAAGPVAGMMVGRAGSSYLGNTMGYEGGFYTGRQGDFAPGVDAPRGNERGFAADFGRSLGEYTGLPAAQTIDAVAAARAADPLAAFMVEQGILPLAQGPSSYASLDKSASYNYDAYDFQGNTPSNVDTYDAYDYQGSYDSGGSSSPSGAESGPGEAGNSAGSGMGTDSMGDSTSFAADGGLATSQGFDRPGLPTDAYADGGMVSTPLLAQGFAQGGQVQMGAMKGQSSPEQVNTQINQMLRDPQVRQRMVGRAQQLMQSGELTPQEVTTMAQVAEAALYNPSLYPQLRAFVMEQGMSPLPPAYDQSVIMKIMAVARALQQAQPATPPGQVPPTDQAQMQNPVPGMANGGYLQGPGTGRSDSIGTVNETTGAPVKVANGEYVIPEHVVRAKGREFFDNLLRRYADVPKEQV